MVLADIRLRPVHLETDLEFLYAVYASTRAEELAATGWSEEQKAQFCRMQFTAQDAHYRQHYPTAQYFIIEAEGAPIGRLYLDRWSHEIRIMDIALLPDYRSQGIGTHGLRQLQEEAQETLKRLTIHVERFNPALNLYQRLGFRLLEDKGVHLLLEWQPNTPPIT